MEEPLLFDEAALIEIFDVFDFCADSAGVIDDISPPIMIVYFDF